MIIKNILIIGFGSIAKKHLDNFIKNKFKGKIFIVSKRKHLNNSNHVSFHRNIKELKDEKISLVVICSKSNSHLNDLKESYKYYGNKAFYLVEKPIYNNYRNCSLFFKKSKINKAKLFVGYQIQYSFGFKKIKELINKNKNKKIIVVNIDCQSYLPNWRNNRYFKAGASFEKKGGGVLLELSHEINYLITLFGLPYKLICCSPKNKSFLSKVDENILAKFFYRDGKIINLKLNFDNQFYSRRFCEIRYVDKLIYWNLNTRTLKVYYKKKIKVYTFSKDKNLLELQYRNLLDCISKNKNNHSFNQSLITLKIVDLMKVSLKKKKLITVD